MDRGLWDALRTTTAAQLFISGSHRFGPIVDRSGSDNSNIYRNVMLISSLPRQIWRGDYFCPRQQEVGEKEADGYANESPRAVVEVVRCGESLNRRWKLPTGWQTGSPRRGRESIPRDALPRLHRYWPVSFNFVSHHVEPYFVILFFNTKDSRDFVRSKIWGWLSIKITFVIIPTDLGSDRRCRHSLVDFDQTRDRILVSKSLSSCYPTPTIEDFLYKKR